MKQYILGTKTIPCKYDKNRFDTYTIFNNPNTRIKEELKNFNIDNTEVEMFNPSGLWKIVEWEENEVKCTQGGNIYYFPRKNIEDALKLKLNNDKIKQIPAGKLFFDCYNTLSKYNNDPKSEYETLTILTVGKIKDREDLILQKTYHISTYHGYELHFTEYNNGCNIEFDDNGDFIVGYNSFELFEHKYISPKIIFENFEKHFDKFKKMAFQYSKGIYFTEKICYVPFVDKQNNKIGYTAHGLRNDEMSYERRGAHIKKPKKFEFRPGTALWEDVKQLLTPTFLNQFEV